MNDCPLSYTQSILSSLLGLNASRPSTECLYQAPDVCTDTQTPTCCERLKTMSASSPIQLKTPVFYNLILLLSIITATIFCETN